MDKDDGAQELFKHPLPPVVLPSAHRPAGEAAVLTQFVTACLGMQEVSPDASGDPRPNVSPYLALHEVGVGAANPLLPALDFRQDIDKGRTQLCHKEGPPESEASRSRLQLGLEQARRTSSGEGLSKK